jgi:hypothetical protein
VYVSCASIPRTELTYATNTLLICTCSAIKKKLLLFRNHPISIYLLLSFFKIQIPFNNAPLVVKFIACTPATGTGASACSPCSSGMYSSAQGISSRIDDVVSFYLYLRMAGATACLGIECEPGLVGFTGRCNVDKL